MYRVTGKQPIDVFLVGFPVMETCGFFTQVDDQAMHGGIGHILFVIFTKIIDELPVVIIKLNTVSLCLLSGKIFVPFFEMCQESLDICFDISAIYF
jgi:hypothetical protein